MRHRTLLAALAALLSGSSGTASAQSSPGYYISGEAGASLLPNLQLNDAASGVAHEHFDAGPAVGGALGYDTGNGWRYEIDSLYQNAPLNALAGAPSTGHISSTSLMANATVDVLHDSFLTPYVGAGLGVQNVGGDVDGLHGRAWKPAYQAEAGLRDDLTDRTSLFGEYRFSQSESAKLTDTTDFAHQHFADHVLMAGLSFKLNP